MNEMLNIKGSIADVADADLIEKTRAAHALCERAKDQCEALELAARLERALLNFDLVWKGN